MRTGAGLSVDVREGDKVPVVRVSGGERELTVACEVLCKWCLLESEDKSSGPSQRSCIRVVIYMKVESARFIWVGENEDNSAKTKITCGNPGPPLAGPECG